MLFALGHDGDAVTHIGKEACDRGVGLAAVVGDLPVGPVQPGLAQGILDFWHVLFRQTGAPAAHPPSPW